MADTTYLGNTTQRRYHKSESWDMREAFIAGEALLVGQHVKFNGSGKLIAVTSTADRPVGVVVTAAAAADDEVVIHSQFCIITRAIANGNITVVGTPLSCVEKDAGTEAYMEYKVAALGEVVSAIAIGVASDTEELYVGVLRMPYLNVKQIAAVADGSTVDQLLAAMRAAGVLAT